jgi:hypothetical protein
LEAFEGKVSLTEILSIDIPLLYGLLEAKNRRNKKIKDKIESNKATENAINNAQ